MQWIFKNMVFGLKLHFAKNLKNKYRQNIHCCIGVVVIHSVHDESCVIERDDVLISHFHLITNCIEDVDK